MEVIVDDGSDGVLFIGDIHFESKAWVEGEALIERLLEVVGEVNPTIVILLGDILHTHEVSRQAPYDQACRLIAALSEKAYVYVQMGNHDLINQNQFLTDKHFFNPMKKWEWVTIVDKPVRMQFVNELSNGPFDYSSQDIITIISLPYVPPSRFIEALDTLTDEGIDWTQTDFIGCHQEIQGCRYRGKDSMTGDEWSPDFPPIISGHIHDSHTVGDNVFYTGSSRQVAADEDPNKTVLHVTFYDPGNEEYTPHTSGMNNAVWMRKIPLGLKGIKEITLNVDEVKTFDFELLKEHYIKLHVKGTSAQLKVFKKSQLCLKMIREGVKVSPELDVTDTPLSIMLGLDSVDHIQQDKVTFEKVFDTLVQTKSETIRLAYDELPDTV